MRRASNDTRPRTGFTLIEMLVVIAIILAIAALAAAFLPNVSDNQNLTRSVDQLEQWLLTAKMRAKADQLATGVRFVPAQGDPPGTCSQFQYIQQPDPLAGGWISSAQAPGSVLYTSGPPSLFLTGAVLQSAGGGQATFANADFTMGGNALLVQAGDYLEVRGAGVFQIGGIASVGAMQLGGGTGATVTTTTIQLIGSGYDNTLGITSPTTNYRILRQPRVLTGEPLLQLPYNFGVDTNLVPDAIIPNNSTTTMIHWSNVQAGPSGNIEILFSPSGAVVGTNSNLGKMLLTVFDQTMNPFDINRVGIVGVQTRTGFIGAYSAPLGAGAANYDPFAYAESGRESGL